jgi:hypothetical protein
LEDGATLALFVEVRRSLDRLVGDVELLRRVCVRLREEGRMAGRGRLPRGFGRRSPSGGSRFRHIPLRIVRKVSMLCLKSLLNQSP